MLPRRVATISGWMYTDATNFVDCPKCRALAGVSCRTPKGRKSLEPHYERIKAVEEFFGTKIARLLWSGPRDLMLIQKVYGSCN
jgi:hypothetical protein